MCNLVSHQFDLGSDRQNAVSCVVNVFSNSVARVSAELSVHLVSTDIRMCTKFHSVNL